MHKLIAFKSFTYSSSKIYYEINWIWATQESLNTPSALQKSITAPSDSPLFLQVAENSPFSFFCLLSRSECTGNIVGQGWSCMERRGLERAGQNACWWSSSIQPDRPWELHILAKLSLRCWWKLLLILSFMHFLPPQYHRPAPNLPTLLAASCRGSSFNLDLWPFSSPPPRHPLKSITFFCFSFPERIWEFNGLQQMAERVCYYLVPCINADANNHFL